MKQITSNTGNAPIKKAGHTSSGKHGSDPNAKTRGYPSEPRDLSVKS